MALNFLQDELVKAGVLNADGSLKAAASVAAPAQAATTAIADITAAPTEADFNLLLAALRAAGILKES